MHRLAAYFTDTLWRWFSGIPLRQTVKITPDVYLGGGISARGLKQLQDWGVTAVVNMRTSRPVPGIRTLHLPTRDRKSPTIQDLERGVRFIAEEVESGGKVYVHCRQGRGRGPTMMLAYLISKGYDLDQGMHIIRKTRNFIRPTRSQMKILRRFANNYIQ
ncbi:MAG: protein-tyrosine phosphatase family protein [Nanoarchaeota archaeon]